jgi:hypothetical protein
MLSSSWEAEQKAQGMIDWTNPKNNWMRKDIREHITQFQDTQIEAEFAAAVEQHRVEEVYWVGGEPLMYEQHWHYMPRIIELGDGDKIYVRYNTNLSRVDHRGINLFRDILAKCRDWQICASLDGVGEIGEYIRTGLDYSRWLQNFRQGIEHRTHARQMRIDFTLTLPGMDQILLVENLAEELGVEILTKVVFSFSPEIVMSPLCLPRKILTNWVQDILSKAKTRTVKDMLTQLLTRPTFEEQWPESYQQGLQQGKQRILKLEQIRSHSTSMDSILSTRSDVYQWWNQIA